MRNIVITGASSGLGAELSRRYASSGVTLGLLGRNEQRLLDTATICRRLGADVITSIIDIRDSIKLGEWLKNFDSQYPVDLVIANAGITYTVNADNPVEPRTAIRDIIDTNFMGVVNTVNPLLEGMRERRRGRVAIIGSLSAWRGIPLFPAYAASKAAVQSYYEALRGSLAAEGITISIISPGFFETPMTRNINSRKQMSLEYAADVIYHAIELDKYEVKFPRLHYWGLLLVKLLPVPLADAVMLRIFGTQKKP